jgi:rhodanese-related sulfurtransferase
MTNDSSSSVLQFGCPEPFESAAEMIYKLRYHTDSWDLSEDLKASHSAIVVIDARSHDTYLAAHIPGAISFPHREMNEDSTAHLDRNKIYVVYCDGIGCNASTKGTYKLAALGFRVKELLGGLDWWRRDGHPVASGAEPGDIHQPQEMLVGISQA